jgi:protein-S-isoprenylcysteine O-methyltransferase Ste14
MPEAPPDRDGANVRLPPPVVALVGLVFGVAAHFVWPLLLPVSGLWRWSLGAGLVALGGAAMGAAIGLFRRTGQDPKPWESTPEIISTGIYRFTRNPMYLGMGLVLAGLGVLLANAWLLIGVPLVWWTIYRTAIRHEEAYLTRKFGTTYTDYQRSVRRWL